DGARGQDRLRIGGIEPEGRGLERQAVPAEGPGLPRHAPVGALEDFRKATARPDRAGMAWVESKNLDIQRRDSGKGIDQTDVVGSPGRASVRTLEDADAVDPVRRDGPGVERRRRGRIDRDRLDAVDGDPGIRGPPARAAVLALVDALVGSGVQGRRLRGIRNETIDVAAERPPRGPDPALRQCGAGKGEETERYGEPKA